MGNWTRSLRLSAQQRTEKTLLTLFAAFCRLDPDVLVIDMAMPVMDGLQATERLRGANCRTKIVFLTIHEQCEYVAAAFAAGASGYVTKRHLGTDLVPAIREVFRGHTFISPSLHR